MTLDALRRAMDAADSALIDAFRDRMDVSAAIAEYKRAHGLPVLDAAREAQVLDRAQARAGEAYAPYARMLYGALLDAGKAYQRALLEGPPPRPFGLVGRRLSHSHSPAIHGLLGHYPYGLYEVEPEDLPAFLRSRAWGGLNVTIPYKQTVLPLCDALSPQARRIGSVNTLLYGPDGRITGHNTDYDGFRDMAESAGISLHRRKVIILGSGGTARTVAQVAADAGARVVITISRTGPDNYSALDRHADAEALVNATPVGMFPDTAGMPVDLDGFPALGGVLDVVYNPLRTRLVLAARARGLPAVGGLSMLVRQAAAASTLFTGKAFSPEAVGRVLDKTRVSLENIVLLGMPGCGKTVVGKALAEMTGRPLLDTDNMVAKEAGKSIPRIFAEEGEAAFRALERKAVAEAAGQTGCVIATGGGTVLSPENRDALRQSGKLFFLRRPLSLLAVEGRPLSVDVFAMAQARMPVYLSACDAMAENDGAVEDAARAIWRQFM